MSHYLADLVAPLDALLLKGDADPSTRAIMSSVLLLDSVPETTALEEAFERASYAVPRMRQRVAETGWARTRQTWVPDDSFHVRGHIRRVGAPGDGSLTAVLEMASSFATTPFDVARPLWDATLVTGVEGDRAVVLLRVHHAVADGVRALEMMANLLDLEATPTRAELPAEDHRESVLGTAGRRWLRTTSQVLSIRQRRADSMARWALDASWRPVRTLSGAGRYARSVVRTYASSEASPSPLFRSRSRDRQLAVLEVSLDQAREVGRAHSATVNDIFLTALLGGLRAYHEELGTPALDLPIAFPINIAGDTSSQEGGNHFSAGVIPGPSSVEDPWERLRLVHELVAARRQEPGIDAPLRLAPLVQQVPSRVATLALGAYARRVDLQASNIIGPDCALYLAGARVERFYAFGPLPGVPIMAVLVSYDGTCTVGFTIDPAAVTDPHLLLEKVARAFAELGVEAVRPDDAE